MTGPWPRASSSQDLNTVFFSDSKDYAINDDLSYCPAEVRTVSFFVTSWIPVTKLSVTRKRGLDKFDPGQLKVCISNDVWYGSAWVRFCCS